MTLGQYDIVLLVEAPDDATFGKALLSVAAQGNIQTETLRALVNTGQLLPAFRDRLGCGLRSPSTEHRTFPQMGLGDPARTSDHWKFSTIEIVEFSNSTCE